MTPETNTAAMAEKNERNARVQARYDELMAEGKRGHYETMFRVVREELDAALLRAGAAKVPEDVVRLARYHYLPAFAVGDSEMVKISAAQLRQLCRAVIQMDDSTPPAPDAGVVEPAK